MLSFHSLDLLRAALNQPLDRLVADRIKDTLACELGDLTHLVVLQPGDTEADLVREVCFSPLDNRLTGLRFGQPGFAPDWDWHERHPNAWELIYTVGNGGFAFLIIIEDAEGVDQMLLGAVPGIRAVKVIGYLLAACIVLSLLQSLAAALIIALGLAVVIGVCVKPAETFGLLGFLLIAGLTERHPATLVTIAGLALAGCLIGKAIDHISARS